jgi:hypothetical protein
LVVDLRVEEEPSLLEAQVLVLLQPNWQVEMVQGVTMVEEEVEVVGMVVVVVAVKGQAVVDPVLIPLLS